MFAGQAAGRLKAAVEAGSEIPFEVAEAPGARSVLYRYKPLSGEFLRERVAELRALDAFAASITALSRIEGISGYLRVLGTTYVPALEHDRAETALVEFLCRVWEDSSTFELEDARFERAFRELESIVYEDTAVNTVLAPILGVSLGAERWELGSGIALLRGDLAQAPPEAVWASGRADEEPNTLITLMSESTPSEEPPLTAARLVFRKLLTALRLLKPGAATLGATAWWHTDEGPWHPVPLGFAGRSRGARYWLEGPERPSSRSCSRSSGRDRRRVAHCRGRCPDSSSAVSIRSRSRAFRTICLRCARSSTTASVPTWRSRDGSLRSAPSRRTSGRFATASSRRSSSSGW